jgi:hypothetical protein
MFAFYADAQTSSLRKKKIATHGFVQLDSLSIVPATFSADGIDSSFYFIDIVNATLTWNKKTDADSVLISYRVFPLKLNKVVHRYSFDSIRNNFIAARRIM